VESPLASTYLPVFMMAMGLLMLIVTLLVWRALSSVHEQNEILLGILEQKSQEVANMQQNHLEQLKLIKEMVGEQADDMVRKLTQ